MQGSFLQIDVAPIIIHKADEPDSGVDFFDADGLASQRDAEVDFLAIQAKSATAGDHESAVMERVAGLMPW